MSENTITPQPVLALERIYVKDLSFESPNVLKSLSTKWEPELQLDMNTKVNRLEEKIFEVILGLTVTVKNAGEVAYICEVQQAGIFKSDGMDEAALKKMLGCDAPGVLYPFGREVVSSLVSRGGYPQLMLKPVDFEGLYAEALSLIHI